MRVSLRQFRTALLAVIVLTLFSINIVHADTIYVYGDVSGTIEKINSSGQKSTFASVLGSYFLTCDSSGNLYATNDSERRIDKYDSSENRTTLTSFPSKVYPEGIAFDNSGHLYVALSGEHGNALDHTIVQLDSSGNQTVFASLSSNPWGLAFNGSNCFYTIDGLDASILKIDMSGNVSTFASAPSGANGLACDSSGNLYATNFDDGTINKYDSSGNSSIFASGLNTPLALAFGSNNNLYVTDTDLNAALGSSGIIFKFDSSRNRSVFATGLDDAPAGIAIYVPEPTSMTILALGGLAILGRRRK
jgi:DNA-binding beta-propeller fold protein YncE